MFCSAMLRLNLFGNLSVVRRDNGVASEGVAMSGRPGGLLAYLALARGRFFTRIELTSVLWPDRSADISIGAFNTTLWRLRKALESPPLVLREIVVCNQRGAVGLPTHAQLQLDIDEFDHLVTPALGKALELLTETDINHLRQGIDLYRDDILAGFTDEWALCEREKYRRRHLNALGRLMQLSALRKDYPGAIGYAHDILDRDALREDIHCELMRLLLANGQRALALRQFEVCRDALKRELVIQPMRETIALYKQIADNAVGVAAPSHRFADHSRPPELLLDIGARSDPGALMHVLSGRDLVESARRSLAHADRQLQMTLPLFGDDTSP